MELTYPLLNGSWEDEEFLFHRWDRWSFPGEYCQPESLALKKRVCCCCALRYINLCCFCCIPFIYLSFFLVPAIIYLPVSFISLMFSDFFHIILNRRENFPFGVLARCRVCVWPQGEEPRRKAGGDFVQQILYSNISWQSKRPPQCHPPTPENRALRRPH